MEHIMGNNTFFSLRQPKIYIFIIFILLGVFLLNKGIKLGVSEEWKSVIGYEYYWISEGMTGGHGYSLAANHRWYFYDFKSEYPDNSYYPTALEEPVYPFLLFIAFKGLGEYGRLAILLLHIVALYMTAIVMYLLAMKIFDTRLGIFASIALLTWWWPDINWITMEVFSPAILGGLCVTCSAYTIIWALENISVKRGFILGFVLAFNCLTLSVGMLFIPIAVLSFIIFKKPIRPFAFAPSIAIMITASVIILPWTLRNYMVFGEVIPIRTGFGLALHQSNPALAATFSTDSIRSHQEIEPIWRVNTAKDAIQQARANQEKRMAMYKRSYDLIELEAPANYSEFNEAQRDKVYLKKSMDFIKSNMKTFIVMTRYRIQAFLVGWSKRHTLVAFLGMIGALISMRNKKSIILVILTLAYIFPFSLVTPLMYRYRYPIEPILFVLSVAIPVFLISNIYSSLRKQI